MNRLTSFAAGCALAVSSWAVQADVSVSLYTATTSGKGEKVGTVMLKDSPHGLIIVPSLKGLSPGLHGFHIHENPSCEPKQKGGKAVAALSAGGHFDPEQSGKHDHAWGSGHLGDLPALYVDGDGTANYPVLAPRLTLKQVRQRAIMVHAGGDNHSDHPAPLGGGGARVACGVIE